MRDELGCDEDDICYPKNLPKRIFEQAIVLSFSQYTH